VISSEGRASAGKRRTERCGRCFFLGLHGDQGVLSSEMHATSQLKTLPLASLCENRLKYEVLPSTDSFFRPILVFRAVFHLRGRPLVLAFGVSCHVIPATAMCRRVDSKIVALAERSFPLPFSFDDFDYTDDLVKCAFICRPV
jgi:hypothetical protein